VSELLDVGDEVHYAELTNEVDAEDLSESDLSSSDAEGPEDPRATAALDGEGPTLDSQDFASALTRAAQLAGLTVVGTTVSDSTKGLFFFYTWRNLSKDTYKDICKYFGISLWMSRSLLVSVNFT